MSSYRWGAALAGLAVLVGLYVISRHNYLLFHTLAEGFSIAVACGIFMVAWNSRRFLDNNYILFLGMAFLFVAGMDLVHTLAYKGINIFEDRSANLPTQLWIGTRYMQAITLLIAPFFVGRRVRAEYIFSGYAAVTALLLLSIFHWKNFPVCFVEGQGLTPFKLASEYVISLVLVASAYVLYLKSDAFEKKVLHLLYGAIFATIAAELAFTLYISAYGFSNLVGHYLKIVAFYLIYKAVIETGLREPYSLLFRNLKESEDRFRSFSEASFEGIVISYKGKILDMNTQAAVMFGYESLSDIIGINGFKLVAPESHEMVKRIVTEESEELYEATFLKKDGSEFDAEVYGKMFDYHGRRVRVAAIRDITERKRAEEALKEAEKKYHSIFDEARDGIVLIDKETGSIADCNPEFESQTGRSLEKLREMKIWEIRPSEKIEAAREKFFEIAESGTGGSSTLEFQKPDGKIVPIEFTSTAVKVHDRSYIQSISRDITERKRAEEELKLNEARFEALYQLSQMTGVPMTELSAFVLERAVELTKSKVGFIGFMDESEETLTVHAWSRHAMDECKINEKPIHFPISKAGIWAETIRQRKPIIINDYETTGEPKKGLPDGHVELSSLLSVPVLEGERIAALAAVGNKETEYDDADVNQLGLLLSGMLRYYQNKRAADELSSEKSKVESLVGGIKAGLVVLDPEARVIWSNDLFQTWFGPLEDIKDLYCYELFRLRNPEEECAALRAMRSGEVEKGESFAYTIGGEERYFQLTTAPVIDKDGKIVQLVELVQDITDHKRLEEELVKHRDHLEEIVKERTAELLTAYRELEREVIERAKAESQLRQSQKMEAVGQLAGGIAHDFNNRLFAIRNYAHILKATEEEGSALETIEKLIVSCDRAAQLVDDLLKFSREKAINPKPIDVSVIVREAHSILEIAAGKEVEFTMNLSSEPLQVMADSSNMEHVLLNLVNNARDVMPEGGKISISTERVEADSVPDDALDGGRACPCALILVSDTGPGLQEDTKDKIFDPFFTTKEIGKGTGLGLAIVYGVVKQHGGFVDVASEPGKGTTFRIFLPLLK